MVYQRIGDGIEELLRRAHQTGNLHRLVIQRDALADELGVALTASERQTLCAASADLLASMLRVLDGPTGPLARPRPTAQFGRDRVTRGIRSKD